MDLEWQEEGPESKHTQRERERETRREAAEKGEEQNVSATPSPAVGDRRTNTNHLG